MSSKQSKHIVPVEKSSPVLVSNGAEQIIQYHLSSDFIVRAKEDGKIIEFDEAAGLYIVEYKSGEKQAIDVSPKWMNHCLYNKGLYSVTNNCNFFNC